MAGRTPTEPEPNQPEPDDEPTTPNGDSPDDKPQAPETTEIPHGGVQIGVVVPES